MMHLGGWTRLWIVLTILYGTVVALLAYQSDPLLKDFHEKWIMEASRAIAVAISSVEKTDISGADVHNGLFEGKTAEEAITWLERVATSPSEEQRIFSSAVTTVNEKHRSLQAGLRRRRILLALAWWIGPVIGLYIFGRSVAWVVEGFPREPAGVPRAAPMDLSNIDARLADMRALRDEPAKLYRALESEPSEMLCAMLPGFASTGAAGAHYEAIRHGVDAILARRHAQELVAATARVVGTMERLNKSATWLAIVGVVVAIVVGTAQIIVPLFRK